MRKGARARLLYAREMLKSPIKKITKGQRNTVTKIISKVKTHRLTVNDRSLLNNQKANILN